jgi:hypothetical protein
MRHMKSASRAALLFLGIGVALSACSATASEGAMPYGYGDVGPGYYSDPAYLGEAPFYGDFEFGGGWGEGWRHDHREEHAWHAHFGNHDVGHAFGHGGLGHAGFGHGGSGHGGGHVR